jgi:hypothetical protein
VGKQYIGASRKGYSVLHKKNLLIVAGAVWLIAGINVLRIGILTYQDYHSIVNYLLSVVVFLLFHFMVFSKLVKKHTARMLGYEREKQPVYRFLDLKAFMIMVVMIGGGILIRRFELLPLHFIAVFYTGLGTALTLAGILFLVQRFKQ